MKMLRLLLLALAVTTSAAAFIPSAPLLQNARSATFAAFPLTNSPLKRRSAAAAPSIILPSPRSSTFAAATSTSTAALRGGSSCSSSASSSPSLPPSSPSSSLDPRFAPPPKDVGASSVSSSVFNLVNNVAGAGILTLPAGMARGTGVVPALLVCLLLGVLSAHSFALIGEACSLTGSRDFKTLWERSVDPKTSWLVDAVIATMCLACSVIYAGILGDVFSPFVARLPAGVLPKSLSGRGPCILAVAATVLFPLSLLKDLSALAFTSVLGFASVLYTVLFIVVRSLDGSYASPSASRFLSDLQVPAPNFSTHSLWNVDFTSLVLASNLGLAYIAHYNAPTYYRDLDDRKRFGTVVGRSFAILTALYAATMIAGYATFGAACRGNLLLNYHSDDKLALLGKVATGFSILFGFPLTFIGLSGSLLGAAGTGPAGRFLNGPVGRPLFIASLLAFVAGVAVAVPDVGAVVGVTGALMGSLIVYIIPALLYSRSVGIVKGWESESYRRAKLNHAMVPFGVGIAVMGVWMTLKGQ